MMKLKKLRVEGGSAFQLKIPLCDEECSTGAMGLLLNWVVISREHNDKPRQTRKRKVKPKRLIRTIPSEGIRAKEIFGARKK
jgi:hypothetical protein